MNQLHDTQTAAACCMSMALVDLIQEILTLFVVVKLLYKALVWIYIVADWLDNGIMIIFSTKGGYLTQWHAYYIEIRRH